MKFNYASFVRAGRIVSSLLAVSFAVRASAQTLFVGNNGTGIIGAYSASNGELINSNWVNGFAAPYAMAYSNDRLIAFSQSFDVAASFSGTTPNTQLSHPFTSGGGLSMPMAVDLVDGLLYVANNGSGKIERYDAISGARIGAEFISGLSSPQGVAVSGGEVFVAEGGSRRIGKYNAATGSEINASFIVLDESNNPVGVAVAGGVLYVADWGLGSIATFNAATGASINSSFITGLANPTDIIILGNELLVSNLGTDNIGKYNATTGAAINANFITGLNQPAGLAVAIPEPSAFASLLGVLALAQVALRRRDRRS